MAKIRCGFVSNSSSSSFIFKIKDNTDQTMNVKDVCSCCGSEIERTWSSIISMIDAYKSGYDCDDKETIPLNEDKYLNNEYINRDDLNQLYIVDVSRDNISRIEKIKDLDAQGQIEIIEEWGG